MALVPSPTGEPSRTRRLFAWFCATLLASLALLAPALWNRFPLLQYDTGGYLARWYEGYLVPSRPAAYGLFLLVGVDHDFWPVLLIQCALTIWVVALVLRSFGLGRRPVLLLGIILSLAVFTTLPWLTSILLTDIFVGLAMLALYLLIFKHETLHVAERLGLVLLIAFAGATHSATLGLILAMACSIAAIALLRWEIVPSSGASRAIMIAVLAVVMTLASNFAVVGRLAWTPGGYGILFGRMLQQGLVVRYLDKHCPTTPLKLCPYRAELPRDADAFLWGDSVFNKLGRFVGLGDEMRTIVLGALKDFPREEVEGALSGMAQQIVRVGTGEGVVNSVWHTYAIITRYTPSAVPAMRAARQQHGELAIGWLNRFHVPIGLAGLCLLMAWAGFGLRNEAFADVGRLAAIVLLAVVVNGAVCGALANPHNRYGARIIWLAPMITALGLAVAQRRRASLATGDVEIEAPVRLRA